MPNLRQSRPFQTDKAIQIIGMNKFGPTRAEHLFRLAFSLAGLAFLAVALALRGMPSGPGLVEVFGASALFFGGSAFFSARALLRERKR
ncbi:MAG: hypothetical protein RIT14_858 [Pseudomonadota bacterium]|jgi:hypothetical protein